MTWFRVGDTAATDPRVLALHDPKDPTALPACFGFLTLLGTLSASNNTDYVINPGFLAIAGGAAAPDLLKRCIRAGLITVLTTGRTKTWKLIDNAPELFHLILAREKAWEKQQKSDTRSKELQAPVYLRDGDACRWCGVPVQPYDNRSRRGKCLDHLRPGLAARGPHDLVVACIGCNGKRGRDWDPENDTPDSFAARWAPKLLPLPRQLLFVRRTVEFLADQGYEVPAGSVITDRAPAARDTISTPTTSGPASQHPAPAGVAAPARSTTASVDQHPAQSGVAATGARTTPTRPGTQPRAASTTAPDQHPASPAGVAATAASTTEPECTRAPAGQHPAPAGVAATESRTDRPPTDRSGSAPPGRVGSGRVGTGGSSSPAPSPSPARPPDPPQSPARPRPTRRGRRRPRTTPSPDQHQ